MCFDYMDVSKLNIDIHLWKYFLDNIHIWIKVETDIVHEILTLIIYNILQVVSSPRYSQMKPESGNAEAKYLLSVFIHSKMHF